MRLSFALSAAALSLATSCGPSRGGGGAEPSGAFDEPAPLDAGPATSRPRDPGGAVAAVDGAAAQRPAQGGATDGAASPADAAPTDAMPARDAEGPATPRDAAISSCRGPAYCNDFEALAVGASPPGKVSLRAGNAVAIADDKAFSGTKSVRVQSSGGSAWVKLDVRGNLPAPTKRATYMRMMLWMENLPGGTGHWSVMGVSGTADGGDIGTYGAFVSFGGNSVDTRSRFLYGGGGSDCDKTVRPPIPVGKWVCLEMKADDTAPAHYGMKVDGVDLPGLSFTRDDVGGACFMAGKPKGVWYVPGLTTFDFGLNYWHTQGRPVRLWIDDVVIDQKPIGCPDR